MYIDNFLPYLKLILVLQYLPNPDVLTQAKQLTSNWKVGQNKEWVKLSQASQKASQKFHNFP